MYSPAFMKYLLKYEDKNEEVEKVEKTELNIMIQINKNFVTVPVELSNKS